MEVGSVYRLEHSKLPKFVLGQLGHVRAVMVVGRRNNKVSVSYPSKRSLEATWLMQPNLDSVYSMNLNLAETVLCNRISFEEFAARRGTRSFWMKDCSETEEAEGGNGGFGAIKRILNRPFLLALLILFPHILVRVFPRPHSFFLLRDFLLFLLLFHRLILHQIGPEVKPRWTKTKERYKKASKIILKVNPIFRADLRGTLCVLFCLIMFALTLAAAAQSTKSEENTWTNWLCGPDVRIVFGYVAGLWNRNGSTGIIVFVICKQLLDLIELVIKRLLKGLLKGLNRWILAKFKGLLNYMESWMADRAVLRSIVEWARTSRPRRFLNWLWRTVKDDDDDASASPVIDAAADDDSASASSSTGQKAVPCHLLEEFIEKNQAKLHMEGLQAIIYTKAISVDALRVFISNYK